MLLNRSISLLVIFLTLLSCERSSNPRFIERWLFWIEGILKHKLEFLLTRTGRARSVWGSIKGR